MNVLIIGSGGREHALAKKIAESSRLKNLFIIPGNPGTAQIGKNININTKDFPGILNFCNSNNINLVVIGPEQPLADGLADYLRNNNISVFGPSKKAARIESDKAFAKHLMEKYNIPTAKFKSFSSGEYTNAIEYINKINFPAVIKASGLAAGKGVVICQNFNEAENAVKDCLLNNKFGTAGDRIVIEEFLEGQEVSVFAITDGTSYKILPPSQDHKRIGEGDKGKNTGGMGAYAPTPFVNDKIMQEIELKIIEPVLKALKSEESTFSGCLYGGLILTTEGPKVIEFNCRFGDPETQVVLPLLKGDFLQLLFSAATGNLDKQSVNYNGGSAICVVASSKGYPEKYKKGFLISGLNEINDDDVYVIHAGTKIQNGEILTNGGRVLNIVSTLKENNLSYCKTKAYQALSKVNFEGIYYRKDIGDKAFGYSKI